MLIVKKVDVMVFIAHVINCTAQRNKMSKKLDIIVSAAQRFWSFQDFTAETWQRILSEDTLLSQVPEPVGMGVGS
jgi:hypothetical protein